MSGSLATGSPHDDGEPRAREVIEASPGAVPGHDPCRRWEDFRGLPLEPPTLVRSFEQMAPRRRPLEAPWLIDPSTSERWLSPEIANAMTHSSPQWFLRDLDRPREPAPVGRDFLDGTDPRALIDEAERRASEARVLPERPTVTSAGEILAEDRRRREELFASLWKPTLSDDEPRRHYDQMGPG